MYSVSVISTLSIDGKIPFNPSFIVHNFPREMEKGRSWERVTDIMKKGKIIQKTTKGRFFKDFRIYQYQNAWQTKVNQCTFNGIFNLANITLTFLLLR